MKAFDPYGRIRVRDIQRAIVRNFRCNPSKFYSHCREREVAHPRQIAMLLARDLTAYSLPQIGRFFHRDHTTVLYSIAAAQERIERDPALARKVLSIRKVLVDNQPDKKFSANSCREGRAASLNYLMRSLKHIAEPAARKTIIVSKWERHELSTDEAMTLIQEMGLASA